MNPFSPEAYDRKYQESKEYKKHYSLSVYYHMWTTVTTLLDSSLNILDLGCGNGQFAQLLKDKKYKNYTGIDFSKVAIDKAMEKHTDFTFICEDLFNVDYTAYKNHTIVALETFEHLDDLELIKKLPKTDIVFSVPNFEAENHYRTYTSEEQIREYFGNLLNINIVKDVKVNEKAIIFVVKAKIK